MKYLPVVFCVFLVSLVVRLAMYSNDEPIDVLNAFRKEPQDCLEYGVFPVASSLTEDMPLTDMAQRLVQDVVMPPEGAWRLEGRQYLVTVGSRGFRDALSAWQRFPLDCATLMSPEFKRVGIAYNAQTWVLILK